jgi:hypothetical protein
MLADIYLAGDGQGRGIDGGFESGKSKRGVERERLGTDTNSSKSQGETLPNPGVSASLRQEVTACMQIVTGPACKMCPNSSTLSTLSTSFIFSRQVGNDSSPSSSPVTACCSTGCTARECDRSRNEGRTSVYSLQVTQASGLSGKA